MPAKRNRAEDTPILFGEFRDWMEHYEAEHASHGAQLGELAKIVHTLSANVQTLLDNQKGLFGRINRPTNWAAYLAGIAVLISFIGLLTAPMQREIIRQHEFDLRVTEFMLEDAKNVGRTEANLQWLDKLETRNTEQIDKIWHEMKLYHNGNN